MRIYKLLLYLAVFGFCVGWGMGYIDGTVKTPEIVPCYSWTCHTDMECAEEAAQLWLKTDHSEEEINADIVEREQP